MTTSNYGRALVPWPNLGSPAGAPLHAEVTGGVAFLSNNLASRWSGTQSVNNAASFSYAHNFGLSLSNLLVVIVEGGVVLNAAQVTAGYTIAQVSTSTISVTNNTGTTKSIEVYVYPARFIKGSEFDPAIAISTTGNIQGANISATGTITASADPTVALQVATKQYADSLFQGVKWKEDARAASTANLTLSGAQTVDGVALIAGDRVLVKDQTTASANGIYVVAAGSWTRATDADTGTKILGAQISVQEGTVNADRSYRLITNATITLGTTSLVFSLVFGQGTYTTTGGGIVLTGNVFSILLDGTTLVQSGLGLKVNVTGAAVGTTDQQVLTNKDYDGGTASNTSRLTIPKAAFSALSALTRKQGTVVYASDQNTLYSDDGTNLNPIGGNWTSYANQAVTSGGTVTISSVVGLQLRLVSGSGGAQTASVTPFGTTPPTDGAVLRLVGTSNTNTVTLTHNDAANGCLLNGDVTLGRGSIIELQYISSLARYVEASRNAILGV